MRTPEADAVLDRFVASDGAVLRAYRHGGNDSSRMYLMVPGWGSTPTTWRKFVAELTKSGEVRYLESREKPSAVLARPADLRVERLSKDVAEWIMECIDDRPDAEVHLIGASTGANLCLEMLSIEHSVRRRLSGVAILMPHARVPIPIWLPILRFVPERYSARTFKVVAGMASRLWMRDDHQVAGFRAALAEVQLSRMGRSARAWRAYRLEPRRLHGIAVRTIVVSTSGHNLHDHRAASLVKESIPNAEIYDASTFARAHSSRTAVVVANWLRGEQYTD